MEARRGRPTRRQLLGAGALAAGCLVGGGYGRFALGDEFEEHVAGVLGIPVPLATQFLEAARDRTDGSRYELRASAFLAVTTVPGRWLTPAGVREDAIRSFLKPVFTGPSAEAAYLGLRPRLAGPACTGLVRE